MLHEVASARDVEDLTATADGEHRHVALEGGFEESKLGAIAFGPDSIGLGMLLGAVQLRVEVGAAREEEPVERVESLLDGLLARRHEQRPPAGALDRMHVSHWDKRCRRIPHAPARLLRITRDPNYGSH